LLFIQNKHALRVATKAGDPRLPAAKPKLCDTLIT
jgi:hypothetical protein